MDSLKHQVEVHFKLNLSSEKVVIRQKKILKLVRVFSTVVRMYVWVLQNCYLLNVNTYKLVHC
jgi:hypothetical protein